MSKQELKLKLKRKQNQERDEEFLERRDLNNEDIETIEIYKANMDTLPKEFVALFTNSHLREQLQKGYGILKRVKKTNNEIRIYLTGAALLAGYSQDYIRNWMPSELKDPVKARSGKSGGYKRGFARRKKAELRGPDSISHDGGVAGSSASKSLANSQMRLQSAVNKYAFGPPSGMVSLRIRARDVNIKECMAKIEEGAKKGLDLQLFAEENDGYVDLKKGFKLVTPL